MQNIDPYSYQCGVIDCFNEMVRSGVKYWPQPSHGQRRRAGRPDPLCPLLLPPVRQPALHRGHPAAHRPLSSR